jgi:hypothetical protein
MCISDFNMIMPQSEKFGGRPYACSFNDAFHGFLDSFSMIDLGFSSNPFTWSNERRDDHLINALIEEWQTLNGFTYFPTSLFGTSQLTLLIIISLSLILLLLICLYLALLDLKNSGLTTLRVVQLSLLLGIILLLALLLSICPKISKAPNRL